MSNSTKMPSDRSIRSALTILKKAGILDIKGVVNLELDCSTTVMSIPIRFLSPKKTRKVPLKIKKVIIPVNNEHLNGDL